MRIAITGANSSVGRAFLRHVAAHSPDMAAGLEIRAGARTEEACATLPRDARISPCLIRYDNPDTLAALLDRADCLLHLAGVLIEGRRSTYRSAHIEATEAVVAACRRATVARIVLVSALGADRRSANGYYRSKGMAEQIVARSGIPATIIRTPILLGPDTAGGRALAAMAARRAVRVPGGGHHALRPLDIDDLSVALMTGCRAPTTGVVVHELVGPERVTQRDLIAAAGRRRGRDVAVRSVPVWMAKLGARIAGAIRRGGPTPDVIDVITADEDVRTNADRDLGVRLTPLATTLEKLHPDGPAEGPRRP